MILKHLKFFSSNIHNLLNFPNLNTLYFLQFVFPAVQLSCFCFNGRVIQFYVLAVQK